MLTDSPGYEPSPSRRASDQAAARVSHAAGASLGRTGPRQGRHDYEVLELLPQTGGQAFVFRARLHGDRLGPSLDGTEISLKQLIAGAIGTDRTAEVLAVLGARVHPHLARILEVFRGPAPDPDGAPADDDTLIYVASAWVEGRSADVAASETGTDLTTILRWTAQIASAVDFLHLGGHPRGPVCHRDIKPTNVVVTPDGDAVLIDPGLARVLADGATGTPHGSPGYVPPECAADPGASGPAGDRWQVAALLYGLLVGEAPGRYPLTTVRSRLAASPHRPSEAIVDGIVAMLDPDPALRPAAAFRWALDLQGRVRPARRRLTWMAQRPAGPRARTLGIVAATAALAAVATATAAGAMSGASADPDPPAAVAAATTVRAVERFLPRDSVLGAGARGDTVTVYNKVTNGAHEMREDVPAYLSAAPDIFCAELGCALPATDMRTGYRVTAVCATVGQMTTNGDDTTTLDAVNPDRYTSNRYYGIRLPDHRFGYLSVVWIAAADRDLQLPSCVPGRAS